MGFGTTIHTTFQGVTQSRVANTFCIKCKKKLKRTVSTTYYRNGFHDEAKTRAENDKALTKEAKKLEREGVVCGKCEKIESGVPEIRKTSPTTWEAFTGGKKPKRLGIIHKHPWGGHWKYLTHHPRRDHRTLDGAALHLAERLGKKTPSR